MVTVISPDKKEKLLPIIKSNLGKISQREIARRLSLGKTTVNSWAKELGFKHKKHTVDENFFDTFTEESTYLLGYIYADGNISWNTKKVYQALTITTAAKDKDHLENIRKIINSTKPLLYSEGTNSYRLIANSKNLCLKLMNFGVKPNKSLTLEFPEFLPNKQFRHFLRGIIDGDGTIYYCNRKKSPYFVIKICSGSEKFLRSLVQKIEEITTIKGNTRFDKSNTFVVEYSCSRGKDLSSKKIFKLQK